MKKKILIYTDSRGQHIPYNSNNFDTYAMRLSKEIGSQCEVILCPMKWTTTLDFIEYIENNDIRGFNKIILHTGIVDWSPRTQISAISNLYYNLNEKNTLNIKKNTRNFSQKVINNKKFIFDSVFGERQIAGHLGTPFSTKYEGQPTVNMYSLEMAEESLLPILERLDNLIFINSNRFVDGWKGDYPRDRPDNIRIIEQYSELFTRRIGKKNTIDILGWSQEDVKKYTCDNIHFTKEGNDYIYNKITERLYRTMVAGNDTKDIVKTKSTSLKEGKNSLISVIVPVYNVERYLIECLESLAAQDDGDFEVIVVDDGSTDKSATLARDFCETHRGFLYVRQENAGLGGARNTGVDRASGEFVTFIDSDDFVDRHYVSLLRREQMRGNFDVVSGQFCRINEAGMRLPKTTIQTQILPDRLSSLGAYQIVLGVFRPSVAWARLYRRELLLKNALRFPERMPHEDLFFTYKALMYAQAVSEIADEIYMYRQRGDSLSKVVGRTHVDAVSLQWDDTEKFLDFWDASPLDRALADRRTLIFIEDIWRKASRSSTGVQSYFMQALAPRTKQLEDLLIRFRGSAVGDTFDGRNLDRMAASLRQHRVSLAMNSNMSPAERANELIFPHDNVNIRHYAKKELESTYGPTPEIANLYNKFKGKRCFIIGNGPSLNKNDLSLLDGEYTFAVNSFYYKTEETGFRPTFFVVEDDMVMKDNIDKIREYEALYKFFPAKYREVLPDKEGTYFFSANWGYYQKSSAYYCVPRFSVDAADVLYCGQTVTYINMQLAFFLGFTEVYLIGMDFSYTIPREHERKGNHIISTTDDPNHFHKEYFGKGKTWKDPKLDRVAASYRHAKLVYEAVGRKIYNATIGGKLEIFDRVDYEALLRDPVTGRKQAELTPSVVVKPASDGAVVLPIPNLVPSQPVVSPAPLSSPSAIDISRRAAVSATIYRAPAEHISVPPAPHRPFYADFGEWLMWRSPSLFRMLQRGRRAVARFPAWLKANTPLLFRLCQIVWWVFRAAWRHKISAVVLLAVCATLVAAPFYDARLQPWHHILCEIAAALLAAVAAGVILRETVRRVAGTNETAVAKAARLARQASERRSGELEKHLGALAAEAHSRAGAAELESRRGTESLRSEIARLTAELSATAENAGGRETEFRAELRGIAEALDAKEEALRADFQALRQGIDQRLHAEIEEHATGLDAAVKGQVDELRKAGEAQGKRLAGFETALGKVQSQAVSLDVVSALRAMRPLWLGGSAVDTLKQQPEIEHGHALLMAVLADEARGNPDWLVGKTLIEIGTTRERDAAQGSTEKLAIFTTMTGMRFVTVDMDSQNTGHAKQILRYLNPAGQAITAKGEDYLALHAGPLDVVYLDAFDFDHGHHPEQRQERYRAVLHTDINDDACWRMHLACAETLAARMPEGGIIALDDTWTDSDGNYLGKGKLAMPFLLDKGFEIVARTRMTVALRRTGKGRAKKAKAAVGGRKKRAV